MLMHEITICWQSEVDMIRSSDNGQMKLNLQLMYYVRTTYKVYMTKTQPLNINIKTIKYNLI